MKAKNNVCVKFAYSNRKFALSALNNAISKKDTATKPFTVYKCKMCKYWHLTSKIPYDGKTTIR